MHLNRLYNTPAPHGRTHEGAAATAMTDEQALRRSVMSCMLWEKEFYEDGEEIAARIVRLAEQLPPWTVTHIAHEARHQAHLRHVPLLLLSVAAKTSRGVKPNRLNEVIEQVISRADELTEFLAIHAKRNDVSPKAMKKTLSKQMKKGLAKAFTKFDEYQLAKYSRDGVVHLRDVLFLCHAKPQGKQQQLLWQRLIDNLLKTPDTWEVALSGGADKKATFERLITEGKLGYLALLRNLRNMLEAGCDQDLVNAAIIARKGAQHVLPFRYTAAARAAPAFEPALDQALCETISELPPLAGKTIVMVDVSGSMEVKLSGKSDLNRMDAAATLASIIPGNMRLFTFSNVLVEVPPRHGMAGVDAIVRSQDHSGTQLIYAVNEVISKHVFDRLIVISDEQATVDVTHLEAPPHGARAYMINVASAHHGVSYLPSWDRIDGFSENVIKFIQAREAADAEMSR